MESLSLDQLQEQVYRECRDSGWDPDDKNTFTEELMHIVAELSEAFEEWRLYKNAIVVRFSSEGKPTGIPIEFADVLIGLLYNAEREGFDLFEALDIKRNWNNLRNYTKEGRQLHR